MTNEEAINTEREAAAGIARSVAKDFTILRSTLDRLLIHGQIPKQHEGSLISIIGEVKDAELDFSMWTMRASLKEATDA